MMEGLCGFVGRLDFRARKLVMCRKCLVLCFICEYLCVYWVVVVYLCLSLMLEIRMCGDV